MKHQKFFGWQLARSVSSYSTEISLQGAKTLIITKASNFLRIRWSGFIAFALNLCTQIIGIRVVYWDLAK